MQTWRVSRRDAVAVLAGLAAPLALAAILVPTLEQRLLAVAFADQVGAALATSHPVGQG